LPPSTLAEVVDMTLARRRTDFRPYSDGPYRWVLGFLARYTSLIVMTIVATLFIGSVLGQHTIVEWFIATFWYGLFQAGLVIGCIASLMIMMESIFGQ
jgi:hypothetical protein